MNELIAKQSLDMKELNDKIKDLSSSLKAKEEEVRHYKEKYEQLIYKLKTSDVSADILKDVQEDEAERSQEAKGQTDHKEKYEDLKS